MRAAVRMAALLSGLTAYYVYRPLPGTVSEPWKLMLLDAVFRGVQDASHLMQLLGLGHHLKFLNCAVTMFEMLAPQSSDTVRVTDTTFDGVQVRVFEPEERLEGELKRSVIYIHGGGWALGSARMRSYDYLCRKMAEDMNAVVISIEYRLVPEVHFPEQINDAYSASKHFLQPAVLAQYSVDPNRIAISGDSAGGNLAAAVSQQLVVDSSVTTRLKIQALIYPVLQALDFNTPSYQQNTATPILYKRVMARFWLEYLNGDPSFVQAMLVNNHTASDLSQLTTARARLNWTTLLPKSFIKNYKPVIQVMGSPQVIEKLPALLDPRAAPLIADEEILQLLPKAYILTCEHDILRDDGMMYARRLEEAGIEVTLDHYEDGFHGAMIFALPPTYFDVGNRIMNNYINWLDKNL
ncbi:neutral cholesterol ester hydrolase 1 [Callorhinchus milii]|uniref:neutral cholesterol ester hydrolase 1 n=1 Tax=Callorhinchus milii TaxID=7868 RepID=UPI0004572AC0|nr:neutral cholesterol ester hydrolase 1 [Callorhinchus milii]|eukprot:gi/632934941/ref/XP_007887120.1/ PREDICTED: neutral cholesterol ester hydrolase 1 [Callorhinchus milii]